MYKNISNIKSFQLFFQIKSMHIKEKETEKEKEIEDNTIEEFMTNFNRMFTGTKYNLQALNKRISSMDKCFNNIMLLNSSKNFEEGSCSEKNQKSVNLDISSNEFDELEKIFKEIEDTKPLKKYNGKRKRESSDEEEGSLYIDCTDNKKLEEFSQFCEYKNNMKGNTNRTKEENKENKESDEEDFLNSLDLDLNL